MKGFDLRSGVSGAIVKYIRRRSMYRLDITIDNFTLHSTYSLQARRILYQFLATL